MTELKKDKIYACGTVRSKRKSSRLPKSEKVDKDMNPGDYEFKSSNIGVRWVKLLDKKSVQFLSNYHDPIVQA